MTLREEMERLAEYIRPGDEMFAKLLRNAADTQEKIAEQIVRQSAADGGNK